MKIRGQSGGLSIVNVWSSIISSIVLQLLSLSVAQNLPQGSRSDVGMIRNSVRSRKVNINFPDFATVRPNLFAHALPVPFGDQPRLEHLPGIMEAAQPPAVGNHPPQPSPDRCPARRPARPNRRRSAPPGRATTPPHAPPPVRPGRPSAGTMAIRSRRRSNIASETTYDSAKSSPSGNRPAPSGSGRSTPPDGARNRAPRIPPHPAHWDRRRLYPSAPAPPTQPVRRLRIAGAAAGDRPHRSRYRVSARHTSNRSLRSRAPHPPARQTPCPPPGIHQPRRRALRHAQLPQLLIGHLVRIKGKQPTVSASAAGPSACPAAVCPTSRSPSNCALPSGRGAAVRDQQPGQQHQQRQQQQNAPPLARRKEPAPSPFGIVLPPLRLSPAGFMSSQPSYTSARSERTSRGSAAKAKTAERRVRIHSTAVHLVHGCLVGRDHIWEVDG